MASLHLVGSFIRLPWQTGYNSAQKPSAAKRVRARVLPTRPKGRATARAPRGRPSRTTKQLPPSLPGLAETLGTETKTKTNAGHIVGFDLKVWKTAHKGFKKDTEECPSYMVSPQLSSLLYDAFYEDLNQQYFKEMCAKIPSMKTMTASQVQTALLNGAVRVQIQKRASFAKRDQIGKKRIWNIVETVYSYYSEALFLRLRGPQG